MIRNAVRSVFVVIICVAAIALSAAAASASTPAPAAERAGISAATGITEACLAADIATSDPSWAMAASASTKVGCAESATSVLQKSPAGAWTLVTTVTTAGDCPLEGVPSLVALDFGLCELNETTAVEVAAQLLAAKYGDAWKQSAWIQCPASRLTPTEGNVYASAVCEFELARTKDLLGGSFKVVNIERGVQLAALSTRSYLRKPRACAIAASTGTLANRVILKTRKVVAGGSFGCSSIVATGSLTGIVDKLAAKKYPKALPTSLTINLPGAAKAGFTDHYQLDCSAKRNGKKYTIACKNTLGDAVKYTFTLTQKPKPKPTPTPAPAAPSDDSSSGGGNCSPNYSGACLQQGIGDYDCEGGSGNGPNYTGPVTVVGTDEFDLDRDGDGSACE